MLIEGLQDVFDILKIPSDCGAKELPIVTHVEVNSKKIGPEGLFFALPGERVDGHDFLEGASKNGAVAAVVSHSYTGRSFGLTLIRVDDTLKALQQLAKKLLERCSAKIIGITGSVGKTTVKEFIAFLLSDTFNVSKTKDSYNGQIGLPVTIINSDPSAELFVLEMGMSKKNEMDTLLDIVSPHVSIVTKVTYAHTQNFEGVEAVAKEKAKILSSPNLRSSYSHIDNLRYEEISKYRPIKTYGSREADAFFDIDKKEYVSTKSIALEPPFSETHLIENLLIAIAVAKDLGVSEDKICERVAKLKPFTHRFEKQLIGGVLIVDDTYNANPMSMKALLDNCPKPGKNARVIAAFGSMKELGRYSDEAHKELAHLALKKVDEVLCIGEETKVIVDVFKKENKKSKYLSSILEIANELKKTIRKGDVVLLKGSNSFKLWEILDELEKTST